MLTIASVTPTLLDLNNYRPISLISNISKIIEKLTHKRINSFLEQKNIFYPFQFCFRDNHSTIRTLIEMTNQVKEACDCVLYASGFYLDLKKAFYKVHHKILFSKLNHCRIWGVANDWFKSFLVNRS